MLRDLHARVGGTPGSELDITARDRLLKYDLTRAAWESFRRLADFGLITFKTDPNRRPDGTVEGGRSRNAQSERHRFYLSDGGLAGEGVEIVRERIREELDVLKS